MNSLILPWPDSQYLPNRNKKLHWGKQARLAEAARTEGFYSVKEQMDRKFDCELLKVDLEFTPPKRAGKQPDADAMVFMLKSHLDGIADAIGIDDNYWRLGEPIIHLRQGSGQVKITFGEMG